ncbi:MAG: hypothetical protein WBL45_03250 [Solirubrobacterales bacterium]
MAVLLAAFPAGASALATHSFLGSFCEPSGIGTAPCEPSFVQPEAVAIDQSSGDLLVVDQEAGSLGPGTLSRFNPDGTPANFSALGTNVIDGKGSGDETPENGFIFGDAGTVQVAVDNSGGETDGNIYLTQSLNGLIDIFDKDGNFLGQLTASIDGPLGQACGVAVDTSGNVYVSEYGNPEGKVRKYEPSGSFPVNGDNTLNFAAPTPCAVAAGAGPTAGSVFVTSVESSAWKFNGSSGANEYEVASGENSTVTVNPESGHVYVAAGSPFEFAGRAVNVYDASGPTEASLLSSFIPPSALWGLAVASSSGNIFVAELGIGQVEVWGPASIFPEVTTEEPCAIGAEGATLCGSVNPAGLPLTECFFEWGETDAYGNLATCDEPDAEEVGEGTSPEAVHAEISGLEPGTTYHYRLVAANANGSAEGDDVTFATLGASIEDEVVSLITPTSAKLSAKVNPNGEETTYVFEYVSEAQFEASGYAEAISLPSPPGEAGSGSEFVEVFQQLTGLEPDTNYHFRLVATTPGSTHLGADNTFSTFPLGATVLPDSRAYELVSPPQKIGEVFPPEPRPIWTGSCAQCLPGLNDQIMPMQASADGDGVVYEGQPFTGGLASGPNEYLSERGGGGWSTQSLSSPLFATSEEQGYKAFSADLSRAVLAHIRPALAPEAPIGGEGQSFSNLYLREADGTLTPLITEEPPERIADYENPNRFVIGFAGANSGGPLVGALTHVIFEANDALTKVVSERAPEAPAISASERNLYEWIDGEVQLVNVAPDNATPISGAVFGAGRLLTEEKEGSGADLDGAISADGSRVFFSEKASGQVYVRIDGEETREIDDTGRFLVASADGSKVLLSDGCLYDVDAEECEADLTQGEGGFEGILGATADLGRIYFVDTKALDAGAEGSAPNLYFWREGATSFIATLDEDDNEFNGVVEPQVGDWMPSSSNRTAQVSPDGRFLVFMSRAPLTGYDNHVRGKNECRAAEPAPCFEVFEYRADSEELICVSCNPSGERPLGTANLSLINRGKGDVTLAGLPQPTNLTSNEGQVFFETQDALVPGDLNGRVKDVYEWEPNGVGSCKRAAGCVSLISSGQSPNDSMFVDATSSGNDAFFITRERLLPQDGDEKLDLYDARAPHVPGEVVGFPEVKIAPCQGETCRGPISSPSLPDDPASAQASGPGNVQPKHKKPSKKKKHHKKKKHKKNHRKRGGHR